MTLQSHSNVEQWSMQYITTNGKPQPLEKDPEKISYWKMLQNQINKHFTWWTDCKSITQKRKKKTDQGDDMMMMCYYSVHEDSQRDKRKWNRLFVEVSTLSMQISGYPS